MIEARDISCIRARQTVFEKLSLSCAPHEYIVVNGNQATGKSSLLKLLAGLLKPVSGHINSTETPDKPYLDFARRNIAYLGPDTPFETDSRQTALEFMAYQQALWALPGQNDINSLNIEDILASMKLLAQKKTQIRHLSTGQKNILALSGLFCSNRGIWIMDISHMVFDEEAARNIGYHINAHCRSGGIVISSGSPLPATDTHKIIDMNLHSLRKNAEKRQRAL